MYVYLYTECMYTHDYLHTATSVPHVCVRADLVYVHECVRVYCDIWSRAPEKPMREGKSIDPPRSCPEEESLMCWCCVYVGKTISCR